MDTTRQADAVHDACPVVPFQDALRHALLPQDVLPKNYAPEVDEKKSCEPLGTPLNEGPEKSESLCPEDDMHVSPVTSPESESLDETHGAESSRPSSGQPDEPMSARAKFKAKYGYDKGRGKKSRDKHKKKYKQKKREQKSAPASIERHLHLFLKVVFVVFFNAACWTNLKDYVFENVCSRLVAAVFENPLFKSCCVVTAFFFWKAGNLTI